MMSDKSYQYLNLNNAWPAFQLDGLANDGGVLQLASGSDGLPFVECVGRVAPGAPQVASGQAHEDARKTGPGRLTLDRMEDFVDLQHDLFVIARATVTDRVSPRATLWQLPRATTRTVIRLTRSSRDRSRNRVRNRTGYVACNPPVRTGLNTGRRVEPRWNN